MNLIQDADFEGTPTTRRFSRTMSDAFEDYNGRPKLTEADPSWWSLIVATMRALFGRKQ